jgi:sulfane dehydrogenase subunit SoxC
VSRRARRRNEDDGDEAHLQKPILSKALTRFRLGWRWDGGHAVLQSRAIDEEGNVQPTREALLARRGARALYHFNGIASWGVAASGRVTHVYT